MADGGQEHPRRDIGRRVGASRMGSSGRVGQRGVGVLHPTDPTDPEVPAAKRLRARRRQRTVIMAGAAVGALLFALLVLLYRMGLQVTTARPTPSGVSGTRATAGEPPDDFVREPSRGIPNTGQAGEHSSEPLVPAASAAAPPSSSQRGEPAASEPSPASPKPSANREFFRRPTF
jgi:hypothetical protein